MSQGQLRCRGSLYSQGITNFPCERSEPLSPDPYPLLHKEKSMSKVTLNPNAELVAKIKAGLEKKGGYCPCRLEKSEDTKCICKEFREQIEDPNFEGYCHCLLYFKSK